MKPFVHLHLHSDYSWLDGAVSIPKLIPRIKQYQMNAVALTDHGHMAGAIDFYKNCKRHGIKPIVGMESYLAPNGIKEKGHVSEFRHLTLLAKDYHGYKNLIKLSTYGYIKGMHWGRARIDLDLLEKYSKGLVGLGGCLSGEIPRRIMGKDEKGALNFAGIYKDIFNGDFYLELMQIGIPENEIVNKKQIEIARKTGVGLVATNDVHFINAEDHEAHNALLCINTKSTFKDQKLSSPPGIYLRSPEEMWELFGDIPEALLNTQKIADSCNLEIKLNPSQPELPDFDIPSEYKTIEEYIEHLTMTGAKLKYGKKLSDKIIQRIKYELDVIFKTGYTGYFLIIRDMVQFARKNKIRVGPGRGSAVSSVVLYSLDITNVDPLKYDLLFERFLNPERISAPDIDLDFSDDQRDRIFNYVVEKYGSNAVSHIGTSNTLKVRQVVRDVARVLGLSPKEIDKLAVHVPHQFKIDKPKDDPRSSVEWVYDNFSNFKQAVNRDSRLKKLISISSKLEGLRRQPGIHAAGLLIAPGELTDFVPLRKDKNNLIVSQYDGEAVSEVGLIKVDVLGLTTLTIIDKSLDIIKQNRGKEIDIDQLPLDDKKTFNLLSKGNTTGVFQLESTGMRKLCSRFKPKSMEDIIAIVALYRPGPMDHIDKFIQCKNGKKKIKYLHPTLEPILNETYGIPIYQEQIMEIANAVAGYNLGQADILRRAMGKKKMDIMSREKDNFFNEAVNRDIPKKTAKKIWDLIEPFAGYGFNKSHGAGYAYLAYFTAYLKAHYPVEFLTATLSSEISNVDKLLIFVDEARNSGIKILPPSINESEADFKVEKNKKIRYALGAIKNVGIKAAQSIVKEREENGKFKGIDDFMQRLDYRVINKRAIEFLIKAGSLDEFEKNRGLLLESLEQTQERAVQKQKDSQRGQLALFDDEQLKNNHNGKEHYDIVSWSFREQLNSELEAFGFYFSAHPLEEYLHYIKLQGLETISNVKKFRSSSNLVAGLVTDLENTDYGCFLRLEDNNSEIGINIPKGIVDRTDKIQVGSVFALEGKVKNLQGTPTFIADKLFKLEDIIKNNIVNLHIKIPQEKMDEETLKKLKNLLDYNKGKYNVLLEVKTERGESVDLISNLKVNFEKDLPLEISAILERNGQAYYQVNINS
ncbi:MAG: hypothetical protein APR63_06390 [Desulfuromonas sp. SDB]|nr:MAG: hypothetical protein APR63_06390 [Desulfuromonas sp. SDB]